MDEVATGFGDEAADERAQAVPLGSRAAESIGEEMDLGEKNRSSHSSPSRCSVCRSISGLKLR